MSTVCALRAPGLGLNVECLGCRFVWVVGFGAVWMDGNGMCSQGSGSGFTRGVFGL